MPFLPQPSLFPRLATGSEYAGFHTLRLGFLIIIINKKQRNTLKKISEIKDRKIN